LIRNNAEEGAKGIKPDRFLLVKMAIGVLRESNRDEKRRAEKAKLQKILEDKKKALTAKAKEVVPIVDAADKQFTAMETELKSLKSKVKALTVPEMRKLSAETEVMIEKAKGAMDAARKKIDSLSESIPPEQQAALKEFLASELKLVEIKMARMDNRLLRVTQLCRSFQADVVQKSVTEFQELGSKVVKVVRYNQQLKKLTHEEIFDTINSKKNGKLDKMELVKFLNGADKDIKFLPMGLPPPSEVVKEATSEVAKENGAATGAEKDVAMEGKEAENEVKEQKKAEVSTEKKEPVKVCQLSEKKACMTIRRAIQKYRVAKPDNIDDLKNQLEEVLDEYIELTGSQKEIMQKEVEKAHDVAQMSVERWAAQLQKDAEKAAEKKVLMAALPIGFQAVQAKPAESVQEAPVPEVVRICSKLVAPKEETIDISEEEVSRLFAHLGEDGTSTITKEPFLRFLRTYMKVVVRDLALTDNKCLAQGTEVRKLGAREVVEVLQGPMREETAGVMRVEVRAFKDGATGWITALGDEGSVFCKQGGSFFKVIKETVLTESMDAGVGSSNRKLRNGEVLELLEFPQKEEKSGLMRMKAKARTDGAVGWVTTVGNTDTVFIDLI